MPSKINIVDGAFKLLVISGITSKPNPEELIDGLQVLDDFAAEQKATLDFGYIQPVVYGGSDPNDYSGITAEMAGPIKKLLAQEIAVYYGKEITPTLNKIANDGMRQLENLLVSVNPSQNPATLPLGSGNEWDYRSDKFYPEPTSDDNGSNYQLGEEFQLPIDWRAWLAGLFTLDSVTYEHDSGIDLTEEAVSDTTSSVTVSFTKVGQFKLCVKATNSNGDIKILDFVYNVGGCNKNNYQQ